MRTSVLIAHTDPRLRSALRGVLDGPEYVTLEAADAESALETLHASERSMLVLFNIALFNNTMTGADCVAILGAAAHDGRLADQHAFVVISPTPENVGVVFGRMLTQIGAPVVAEPVDLEALRLAIARVSRRLLVTA